MQPKQLKFFNQCNLTHEGQNHNLSNAIPMLSQIKPKTHTNTQKTPRNTINPNLHHQNQFQQLFY